MRKMNRHTLAMNGAAVNSTKPISQGLVKSNLGGRVARDGVLRWPACGGRFRTETTDLRRSENRSTGLDRFVRRLFGRLLTSDRGLKLKDGILDGWNDAEQRHR